MLPFAATCGVELSHLVTLGNEAMIGSGSVIDFLVDDEQTKAIALFIESFRDPEIFVRAARRAAESGKGVVVLKTGRSDLAARAAAAHTGAFVGDDRVIDAVLRELGVMRVSSIEDLILTAHAMATIGRLRTPGIGVVSISGGACGMLADIADEIDVALPTFSDETRLALEQALPDYGTAQNPLDVTGAAVIDQTLYRESIEIVARDPGVGVIVVVQGIPWLSDGGPFPRQMLVNAIGAAATHVEVPVVIVNHSFQPVSRHTRDVLSEGGVSHVINGLRYSLIALGNLAQWSATISALSGEPAPEFPGTLASASGSHGAWSEHRARQTLEAAGIPVVPAALAMTAEDAVDASASIGGPVVLKIVSGDILHKSDIGGVRLGVEGASNVRNAFEEILVAGQRVPGATVEGVLVSPFRSSGVELLVGVVRNEQWGLMLAVALGGVLVEVLDDSVLATVPVTPAKARAMLHQLRAAKVLHGVRGYPPADLDRVAEVIARVGNLALQLGNDFESLEINPLRVDGSEIEALDALITWRAAEAS